MCRLGLTFVFSLFIFTYSLSQDSLLRQAMNDSVLNLTKYKQNDLARKTLTRFQALYHQTSTDSITAQYLMAIILKSEGKLEESAEYLEKVLKEYEKLNDFENQLEVINQLAQTFEETGNIQLSNIWYKKGLAILKTRNIPEQNANFLNNLGVNLKSQNKLDSAVLLFNQSIEIQNANVIRKDGVTTYNLGTIFSIKGKHHKAIEYYKKSIQTRVANKDSSALIFPINEIALTYIFLDDFDAAKKWLDKGLKLPKNATATIRFFEIQAEYYRLNKQYSQYEIAIRSYVKAYKNLVNDKRLLGLQEMSEKYESDKKNEQIKTQNLLLNLNNSELEIKEKNILLKNQLIIIISATLLALVFLLLLFYQRSLKRSKQSKIKILEAKIEGEETTKSLIGSNMHDFVLSDLHAIRFKLEAFQYIENIDKQELKKIAEDLRLNTKELRTICHELSAPGNTNTKLNFGDRIRKSIATIVSSSTENVSLEIKEETLKSTINLEIQNTLIAIIKEGLINAVKHANCSNILIKLSCEKNYIYLSISDDGKGMQQKKSFGIGLANIKSRVKLFSGEVKLSNLQPGTELKVKIRLDE